MNRAILLARAQEAVSRPNRIRQNRFQFIGSAEGCIGLGYLGSIDDFLGSSFPMFCSLDMSRNGDDPEDDLEGQ